MNTRKLFLTSLLAAAAMSATAYADESVTWNVDSGHVYKWTGNAGNNAFATASNWFTGTYSDGSVEFGSDTGAPSRGSVTGYVLYFDSNASVSGGTAHPSNTSDGGGIWVTGTDNTVTASMGQWAGSIQVDAGNVLNTSWSTQLKDGKIVANGNAVVNVTSGNLNFDQSGVRTWYTGENGQINIQAATEISNSGSVSATGLGTVTFSTLTSIAAGSYVEAAGATVDFNSKTVSGAGSIKLSSGTIQNLTVGSGMTLAVTGGGLLSNVTFSEGSNLNLDAGSSLELSGNVNLSSAITNSGTVTVSTGTVFNLTQTGATTLISGGTIDGWNSLLSSNFTYRGVGLDTMRSAVVNVSTAGAVTFSYAAADLTWAGTSENSTWNTSNTNWTNNGTSGAFCNFDNVTFGADATFKTVTFENGADITVGTMTVSGGTASDPYILKVDANQSATVSGTKLTVESGAYLQVGNGDGNADLPNGRFVRLDFDEIVLSGKIIYNNDDTTWRSLEFASAGAELSLYDCHTTGLTIENTKVNANASVTADWGGNSSLGVVTGTGNLSITGGRDATKITVADLTGYSGMLSVTKGSGSMTLELSDSTKLGATAGVALGANTTFILNTSAAGTFSLENVTGEVGSTIAVNASSTGDAFTGISRINSDYKGALKVTGGFLNFADPTVINGSNIEKIVLAGGTGSGLCFVRGSNITVSKDIVAEGENGGALRSYASNDNTVTFSGTVTGTAIRHYDGGTHTFTNTVSLDSFSAEAGVTEFSGASTTLGTLNFSGGGLKLSGTSVSIGTLNTSATTVIGTSDSATVKLASGQLRLGVLTLQGTGHSLSVESGTVVSVERFWGSAGGGAITTAISGVLNVSGSVNSAQGNAAAFLMANSGGTNTISVEDGGVLNLANAGVSNRDGTGVLNIKTGGEANFGAGLYVLTNNAGWGGATVNLDGGTLNVGGNSSRVGISTDGNSNVAVNLKSGTLGSLSDSWSTALGFALEGALTIDTTKKEISALGKATATDSGSNVAFEGVISDATDSTGSLKKAGAGTLKLSGNNTFSGGVKLEAGTLELGHNNALGNGTYSALTVTGDSELKLGGGLNVANNVVFDNSAGMVSTLTINVAADTELSGGLLSFDQNEIRKVGAGTLTLSGDSQLFSHGTISIEKGTILAKSANALGAVAKAFKNKVRLSGGQLEVGSGVTLAQTNIEIVLSDAYSSTAAITGDGALATGTTITIADIQAAAIAAESALANDSLTFKIATADSTIATSLEESNFVLAEDLQGTWQISDYTNGVLTIAAIPEPSTFGLLAGLGALALAGTRRRRKKA